MCQRYHGTVGPTLTNWSSSRRPSRPLSFRLFNWNCRSSASARPTTLDRLATESTVARAPNRRRRRRCSPVTARRDANRRWRSLRRNSLTRHCLAINLCQPTTLPSGWLNWSTDWVSLLFPFGFPPHFIFSLIDYPQRMTKSDEDRPLATDLFFIFTVSIGPALIFWFVFFFFCVCVTIIESCFRLKLPSVRRSNCRSSSQPTRNRRRRVATVTSVGIVRRWLKISSTTRFTLWRIVTGVLPSTFRFRENLLQVLSFSPQHISILSFQPKYSLEKHTPHTPTHTSTRQNTKHKHNSWLKSTDDDQNISLPHSGAFDLGGISNTIWNKTKKWNIDKKCKKDKKQLTHSAR